MGHQEDRPTPCGAQNPDGSQCPGTKSTIYVYDDWGNCISQSMYPCNVCGR